MIGRVGRRGWGVEGWKRSAQTSQNSTNGCANGGFPIDLPAKPGVTPANPRVRARTAYQFNGSLLLLSLGAISLFWNAFLLGAKCTQFQ